MCIKHGKVINQDQSTNRGETIFIYLCKYSHVNWLQYFLQNFGEKIIKIHVPSINN